MPSRMITSHEMLSGRAKLAITKYNRPVIGIPNEKAVSAYPKLSGKLDRSRAMFLTSITLAPKPLKNDKALAIAATAAKLPNPSAPSVRATIKKTKAWIRDRNTIPIPTVKVPCANLPGIHKIQILND